jgi:hypothetical protein
MVKWKRIANRKSKKPFSFSDGHRASVVPVVVGGTCYFTEKLSASHQSNQSFRSLKILRAVRTSTGAVL